MSTPVRGSDFVICDVETTGMSPAACRVTEICLLKVRDGILIDSFESLVNPQQYIPEEITRLTGITNAMVYGAPTMPAIAREIASFLEGSRFVAHNATFDWNFVTAELTRAEVTMPDIPVLCTVRLARRVFPGLRSYKLSNVTASLGIPLHSHHRARGDTEATAQLFASILQRAAEANGIEDIESLIALQHRRPPAKRTPKVKSLASEVESLPLTPGVYFFLDAQGEILYIGKAKNLRARVRSYFASTLQETGKVRKLLRRTAAIKHETLPSELHALLREAKLIEQHQPEFNSALRRKKLFPFLRLATDDRFPRIELAVDIAEDGAEYFGPFRTFGTARLALDLIDHHFNLRKCEDALHPDPSFAPCFYFDIKRCEAPCATRQSAEEYAAEVDRVRKFLAAAEDNIVQELEARMRDHAARLEFEDAAFLRDKLNEVRGVVTKPISRDPSVAGQNYLFLLPTIDKLADCYFVRSGRLEKVVRGALAPALYTRLRREIAAVYYQESLLEISQESAREMRILAGWIGQRKEQGCVVPMPIDGTPDAAAEAAYSALSKRGLVPALDND